MTDCFHCRHPAAADAGLWRSRPAPCRGLQQHLPGDALLPGVQHVDMCTAVYSSVQQCTAVYNVDTTPGHTICEL